MRQAIESIQVQTVPTNDFVLVCDGPLNPELDAVIAAKQQEMGESLNVVRLAKNGGLGIMISASHNPYYDNGIKLIDCYGEKMPEEILLLVEDYIDGKLHVFDKDWPELPFAHREHIGCTVDYVAGRNRYMQTTRSSSHAADKNKTPPDKLSELLFYAGGGGLPRTERQPAGLIARPAKQGRAVRPAHMPQIKKKTPPDKLGKFSFYAGGGGRTHTCY